MAVTRKSFAWGEEWRNEDGQYHREDGPAIKQNGVLYWYLNGLCHRENGPAIEWKDGWEWHSKGRPHRICGPSEYTVDGFKWFVDGANITKLVMDCLFKTGFPIYTHLGILADRMAELGDFQLLEIVQPYLENK